MRESRRQKRGRGQSPSSVWRTYLYWARGGASGPRRAALGAHLVHQPRCRDDEERRQEEAEQGVQPNQCDIEAPEPDSDPKGAQWPMSFQARAPEVVSSNANNLAAPRKPFQPPAAIASILHS